MEKNINKYNSYTNAINQINAAIQAGFFLEAITIEESILSDKLLRFCRDNGYSRKVERVTLGDELRFIKSLPETKITSDLSGFLTGIDTFWMNRNTCLHQITKSDPGTPTIDYEQLTHLAKKTAQDGRSLTKKVSNWSAKYKKASAALGAEAM